MKARQDLLGVCCHLDHGWRLSLPRIHGHKTYTVLKLKHAYMLRQYSVVIAIPTCERGSKKKRKKIIKNECDVFTTSLKRHLTNYLNSAPGSVKKKIAE